MLQDLLIGVYSLMTPTIASTYYETNTLLSALGTLGHATRIFEGTMHSRTHMLVTVDTSTAARDQAADVNSGDRGTSLGPGDKGFKRPKGAFEKHGGGFSACARGSLCRAGDDWVP